MKASALFLIACVAVSAYGSHIDNIFAEINTSEFGKTIVNTINLQLQSGASVDIVIDEIRKLKDGLLNQKDIADANYQIASGKCQDDTSLLIMGIIQAEADITKFTASLEMDKPVLMTRSSEKTNKEAELAERVAMGEALDAERDVEIERFKAIVSEHAAVRRMLDECRDIIKTRLVKHDDEFLQTNMFMELSSKLNSFKVEKRGLAHGYKNMFVLLAKMVETAPVQADQNVVQNILDILDRVEANLDNSLAIEREAENEREEIYDDLKARIDKQIRRVDNQLINLNQEIHSLEMKIHQSEENLEEATGRHANTNARLDDRKQECAETSRTYNEFNANIMDEITVCGQAIYILEDKRNLLARYG